MNDDRKIRNVVIAFRAHNNTAPHLTAAGICQGIDFLEVGQEEEESIPIQKDGEISILSWMPFMQLLVGRPL